MNNEELQSRREFFKRAAKAALPVIGAIVLANMPIQEIKSCTGCQKSCVGSCEGTCEGTCLNHCKLNCSSCGSVK